MDNYNTMPPLPPREVTGTKRFVSALIDYIVMMVISFIMSTPLMIFFFTSFSSFIPETSGSNPAAMFGVMQEMMSSMMKYQMVAMVVTYLYFLCKDLFGGRSPGKRSQNLQLVMKDGSGPVSNLRMVLRNITIIIWFVELVMYFANPKQRLGDMLCGTTVVNATEENKQETDNGKVAITIGIVFLVLCVVCFLYYKLMLLFFEFYFNMLSNLPY